MIRDQKIEMKVGIFMGVGIFIMFLIVFSVRDFHFLRDGYEVEAMFDFVNGIKTSSPVRLAGVGVGEVNSIRIFYDDELRRTRVGINMRLRSDVRIEDDAVVRINTLGLLGEQYAEITPGTSGKFLKDGDTIEGRNPVNVGMQMELFQEFAETATAMIRDVSGGEGTIGKLLTDDSLYVSLSEIFRKLSAGEGTLGRLLEDESLYSDLSVILGRIRDGEGTVGKLLVEEDIYNDLKEFVEDIKLNPWKLLRVTSERRRESSDTSRGTTISPR